MGRTLLLTAHLPHSFWVEAFCTTVYLINRLPTSLLKWETPFRRLFHTDSDYSLICTFGCTCYPYLGAYVSKKLQLRSLACVFVAIVLIIMDIAAITLPPGVSIPLDILSFTNITFSTLPLHSRQPLPLIWFMFQFSQGQICSMGPPTSHIDTGPMPHTEPNSLLTRHAHVESPTTVAILTPSSHASPFNPVDNIPSPPKFAQALAPTPPSASAPILGEMTPASAAAAQQPLPIQPQPLAPALAPAPAANT